MNELTVEIFATGKWNGMQFEKEDLNSIASAFHSLGDNMQVPLKFGHNDEQQMTDGYPALGWVTDVWVEGDKLLAKFTDIPDAVFNAIESKLYRNVSIELEMGVEWKKQFFNMVLTGVALLGADIPAVNVLADLQAYMSKSQAHFTSERKLTFSYSKETTTMSDDLQRQLQELKAELNKAQNEALTFRKQAEDSAEAARKASFEAQRKALFTKLDEGVRSGAITPAARETFMSQFSETSEEANKALMFSVDTLLPMTQAAKAQGTAQDIKKEDVQEGRASDVLFKKASDLAFDKKIPFSAARNKVLEQDFDLAKAWMAENGTV